MGLIASCYYRVPLMAAPPGVEASDVAGILAARPPASDYLVLPCQLRNDHLTRFRPARPCSEHTGVECDTVPVAGLSPVPGFHTAAVACSIAYVSTLLSLLISHLGPASEINEKREAMSVRFRERLLALVVVLLQTLAAITASVAAAAVLG
jgi:hypothetical protein